MKNLKLLKFAVALFAFSALLTSCATDNSDEIEEVTETIYEMKVTIRGGSNTYDAYAAYCNENGIESFSVSNKLSLLGNDAWANDVEEGDFVIHYRKDESSEFSIGGAIIESTVNGQTLKNFTLTDDSNVDITIEDANETEVVGEMSGDFLVITDPIAPSFEQVPFSVEFAGEVDASLVPIFCE